MPDYTNPIGPGLKPARVDMGVDYTGSGPLYALGSGVITNVYNTGWPGGTFIGLKLDSGKYVYYAENIAPSVRVSQRVKAGQQIGYARGTYPFIEVGWASAPGTGETAAAAAGQSKLGQSQGDPGKYPTGYGVSFSDLIKSLGGPAGIVSGPVQGSVPSSGNVTTAPVGGVSTAGLPAGCMIGLILCPISLSITATARLASKMRIPGAGILSAPRRRRRKSRSGF